MKLKKIKLLTLAIPLLFSLNSCDKKESTGGGTQVEESGLEVNVTLSKPEDIEVTEPKKVASNNKNGLNDKPIITEFKEFDAIQTAGIPVEEKNKKLLAETTSPGNVPVPMKDGTKYVLFLFKKTGSTQTYYTHSVLTANQGTPGNAATQRIDVIKGDTYYWYAYSFNSSDNPAIATYTNTSLTLPGIQNKELVYAAGEVTVSATGNKPLNISFLQQMARISIEFDARGMFTDDIEKINAELFSGTATPTKLNLKKGDFNLLTGTFETASVLDYELPNQVHNSVTPPPTPMFVNVEPLYKDRKVAYIYSVPTNDIAAFRVKLKDLSIKIDNNTTRAFTNLESNFDFTAVKIQKNKNYRLKIDLIESPLNVTGLGYNSIGIVSGTRLVRWARQNIYFTGVADRNPYRFYHTYAHQKDDDYKSMFAFLADQPAQYKNQSIFASNGGDPCLKVHPANVWRSANNDDWKSLGEADKSLFGSSQTSTANAPTRTKNLTYYSNGSDGLTSTLGYWEFDSESAVPQAGTYPSNKLRFNANGYIGQVSALADIINLSFSNSSHGASAYYWAQENLITLLGIPGLLDVGQAYTYFTRNDSFNKVQHNYNLTLGLLGLSVLESNFYNVRCVRN